MQFTALQIGQLLNGTIEGNPEVAVSSVAKIEEAQSGSLSFLANPRYEPYLYTSGASIIIVNEDLKLAKAVSATLIRVKDAYSAFSVLLEAYNQAKLNKNGIEEPCFIHPSASIGKNVYIGAFAYIGANVVIGDHTKIYPQTYIGDMVKVGADCTLFAGVHVYHECVLGNRVTIHSGSVIGSDGFGFAPQADGTYKKIAQIGNVVIEDDVEIGSNSSVDRATMGSTVIKKGVKLDNLIQVAHNVEIGANTVIAAQSGISGSSKVGENVVMGGQVGVAGHITVAKGSQIQAKAGVNKVIEEEGKKWGGMPITYFSNFQRSQVVFQRLPELERKVEELEKQLQNMLKKDDV